MPTVPNYNAILQSATQQAQAGIQPAIQSYQQSIPGIESNFAGQKNTLAEQYKSIIGDLTQRQGVDEAAQNRVTSQGFEERGLVGGNYLTEIQNRGLQPIRSEFTSRRNQAGIANTSALSELDARRQSALDDVRNQIALLQSGASSDAVRNALALYGQQSQDYQSALDRQTQLRLNSNTNSNPVLDAILKNLEGGEVTKPSGVAKPRNDLIGLASYALEQIGDQNKWVDLNERNQAIERLRKESGLSAEEAIATVDAAISQRGFQKYRW